MLPVWIAWIQRKIFGYFIYILHHIDGKILSSPYYVLEYTVAPQNPTD